MLSVTGLGLGIIAWLAALDPSFQLSVRITLLLFTWFTLWFFSHDLTHHVVGTLVGVRFQYYFLGRSAITRLKLPLISRLMGYVPVLVLKNRQSLTAQGLSRVSKMDACFRRHRLAGPASSGSSNQLFTRAPLGGAALHPPSCRQYLVHTILQP